MAINHPVKGRIGDACFDYGQFTGARFGALVPLPLAAPLCAAGCGKAARRTAFPYAPGASSVKPNCLTRQLGFVRGLLSQRPHLAAATLPGRLPDLLTRPG